MSAENTTSALSAGLKIMQDQDAMVEAIANQVVAWKLTEEMAEDEYQDMGGQFARFASNIIANEGVGFTGENGATHVGSVPTIINYDVYYKYADAGFQVSRQMLRQGMSSKQAYANFSKWLFKSSEESLVREVNRCMYGTGRGTLAVVSSDTGSGTNIVVKNPGGVTGTFNAARYLRPGMIVAFITLASPSTSSTITGSGKITAVDYTTNTITLAASTSFTNGDLIVRCSKVTPAVLSSTSFDNEIMGWMGMSDNGNKLATYQGVSRSSYEKAQGWVITANGELNAKVMRRLSNAIYARSNKQIKAWLMHSSVRDQYLDGLMDFVRFSGVKGIDAAPAGAWNKEDAYAKFAEKSMVIDEMAPYYTAFAVCDEKMKILNVLKGTWVNEDGLSLHKIEGSNEYEALYSWFFNLAHNLPNSLGRIDGISVADQEMDEIPIL